MNKIKYLLAIILCLCAVSAYAANGDILAVRIANSSPGDGWIAEIDIENLAAGGTYNFGMNANNSDPENAKVVFTVTSQGYDTTGTATTITRTIYGVPDVNLGAVRKPYPNQASPQEAVVSTTLTVKIALSDFIYDPDTLTVSIASGFYTKSGTPNNAVTDMAVTNNSTLAYPTSVGRWAWVPYEQVKASTYRVEATIFNRFARNGKPVAAVKISCTDTAAHGPVEYTVTDMTLSTRDNASASGNKVLVYAADVDLTTLDALDNVTCNFTAYPWVGDAGSLLTSSTNADPDERLTPFVFYNDKNNTLAGGYAVVDPNTDCGGTWSSGHSYVYETQALAEAAHASSCTNSYKYIGGALSAIKDYNDNHSGTGVADVAGGTVLLVAGNHQAAGQAVPTAASMGSTWVTIQPVSDICSSFPCSDNTSVVINYGDVASFYPIKANQKYHYRNISINHTSSYILGSSVATNAHLWMDGCNYIAVGTAPHYYIRHRYMTGCTIASDIVSTAFSYGAVLSNWRLIRGNNAAIPSTSGGKIAQLYCVLGNNGFQPSTDCCGTGNAAGLQIYDNSIWAFNTQTGLGNISSTPFGFGNSTDISAGIAIVQNLIEYDYDGTTAVGALFHDGCRATSNNIIFWHNTWVGERINAGYNDGTGASNQATAYLHINWSWIGNLGYLVNYKGDVFGAKKTITGISKAASAVFTSNAHGYAVGNKVYIEGATGEYAALNGNTYTISAKDTNTFTTDADTSALTDVCGSGCGTVTFSNPARVGGWPVEYRVGYLGNGLYQDSNGSVCAGNPPWFGSATGMYSTACNTLNFSFVHDSTAKTGDSTGTGGNYRNNSNSSAFNLIPSGKNVLPYDIDGKRRRTEADDAGCYVRGLGKMF